METQCFSLEGCALIIQCPAYVLNGLAMLCIKYVLIIQCPAYVLKGSAMLYIKYALNI